MKCKKCKKNQAVNQPKVEGEGLYKDNELCENCLSLRKHEVKNGCGLGGLF